MFIGVLKEIKPVISFTKAGIKAINLIPQVSFVQLAITGSTPSTILLLWTPSRALSLFMDARRLFIALYLQS